MNEVITAHLIDGRTIYFRPMDVMEYDQASDEGPAFIVLRDAFTTPDLDRFGRLDEDEVASLHDDPHHDVIVAAYELHTNPFRAGNETA